MADGWNSGLDREAMLRRVAIVLSSLPAPVAANLLGEIDENTKQAVRRTMTSLSDVDPLEHKRALHAFKISVQKPDASPDQFHSSTAAESEPVVSGSVPQQAGNPVSRVVESGPDPQRPIHPFAFVEEVNEQALVELLGTEHPQTVAIVLASIQPEHAARILPRLDAGLQQEALTRIGRLGEIPAASVTDVAEHFRRSLANKSTLNSDSVGRRALDAILAAMPNASDQYEPELAPTSPPVVPVHVTDEALETLPVRNDNFPSAVSTAEDLSSKLRIAEGTSPTSSSESPYFQASSSRHRVDAGLGSYEASVDAAVSGSPGVANPVGGNDAFPSTDSIHQHLLQLSPQNLCETLGKVETRTAMLALCGLPNQVTSAVLAILPRTQSRKVREAMNSLGTLQLREIDQAKEAIAYASRRVANPSMTKAA